MYPEFIEWLDHSSFATCEWRNLSTTRTLGPCKVVSLGWVEFENKKFLILTPHCDTTGKNGIGSMCILKRCIIKRYIVRK